MGILQKAEEVLKGHHHQSTSSTSSTNHGPHDSNVANKVDPRADSDRGMASALKTSSGFNSPNWLDNRARHQAMGGAAGPHSSNLANKVDPRVDSDRGMFDKYQKH
jgi:soluble lytic murein transglycosylase-like protein